MQFLKIFKKGKDLPIWYSWKHFFSCNKSVIFWYTDIIDTVKYFLRKKKRFSVVDNDNISRFLSELNFVNFLHRKFLCFLKNVLNYFKKFLHSRKFISRKFINFFIRESLYREILRLFQFAKVYPKKFANFWPRESFSRESFSE